MAKLELDWANVAKSKVYNYLLELGDENLQKEFAKVSMDKKEGKYVFNPKNARDWLTKKYDGTDVILWKNRPTGKSNSRDRIEDLMAKWLD